MYRLFQFLQRSALNSLRGRLLLLMTALGVPFGAYFAVNLAQTANAERAHAQRTLGDAAQLAAARLDNQLGDVRVLLTSLGQGLGSSMNDAPRANAVLQGLAPELASNIYNISLWGLDGRNVASLRPSIGLMSANISQLRYFKEVIRTGKPAMDAPLKSPLDGSTVAVFGAPAYHDGKAVGVVAVSIRLDELPALIDARTQLPQGSVITVIGPDDKVLARSLDAANWIGKTMPMPAALRSAVGKGPGAEPEQRVSFDGVPRLFGHATVKDVPWAVFVGMPTEVAMASFEERLRQSLMLGGAMLMLGLGLALWTSQRIAAPLGQLGADAATIGAGALGHRSAVGGMHEIASLAGTLNDMAQSLQQRAQALQQSRQLLRTVTDHVPALVSLLDRQERFLFANRAYADWLGLSPGTLTGRSLQDIYGEEAYRAMQPHHAVAWAGTSTVYERCMATLQGDRWVQVTLVPRRGPDGSVDEVCAMILDVTERQQAQRQLALSEERLSLATDSSGLGLFDWDIAADRIYHSAQATALGGGAAVETLLTPAEQRQFVHPEDVQQVVQAMRRTIKGECEIYSAEFRLRHDQHGWVWVRSLGRVVERDANGRALRLAGTYADITQRKEDEQRLQRLAQHDHLTGLPNRALFALRLEAAVQRAQRTGQPMAVMFLDIDHFKGVNDTLGHAAGDELLKTFARRLTDGVRPHDTVARLAGDEFTVILEGLSQPGDARRVADALVASARRPVGVGASELRVTTSVGVAVWTHGALEGSALLRQADAALYRAKRRGRDQCAVTEATEANAALLSRGADGDPLVMS